MTYWYLLTSWIHSNRIIIIKVVLKNDLHETRLHVFLTNNYRVFNTYIVFRTCTSCCCFSVFRKWTNLNFFLFLGISELVDASDTFAAVFSGYLQAPFLTQLESFFSFSNQKRNQISTASIIYIHICIHDSDIYHIRRNYKRPSPRHPFHGVRSSHFVHVTYTIFCSIIVHDYLRFFLRLSRFFSLWRVPSNVTSLCFNHRTFVENT